MNLLYKELQYMENTTIQTWLRFQPYIYQNQEVDQKIAFIALSSKISIF
jgi:hypothetical protein